MADGSFPGLVSKDRNLNAVANPIYVQFTDGTTAVGMVSDAIKVNITNASLVVTATDLDIRDLAHATDSVQVWGNTAKDGSGTAYVPLLDADGKIIISNPAASTEYTEDAVAPAAANGGATLVKRDDALAGVTPAEGDWVSLLCNANGALWVKHDGAIEITDGGNTITVDGTVAATQSGVWDIGTVTTLTGITNDVNIADGGNSITVDGTVAATQSGVWNIGTVASITADVSIDDGGNSITVDAADLDIRDLTHVSDSVKIGDGTDLMAVNTDGSINVNIVTAALSNEVNDYDTASSVSSDSSSNHDYAVANTTFLLKSIIVSASGSMKVEVQVGPVAALVTKAVVFLQGRQGDTKQIDFNPAIEVPAASTGTVRLIRTNRQGAAMDVYSTILGNDI